MRNLVRRTPKSLLAPFFLMACASQKAAEYSSFEMSVISMGVPWKISAKLPTSVNSHDLQTKIEGTLQNYDLTFSDWTDESELRRLEKSGLTKFQKASPLFVEGLRLSDEAHKLSGGFFDPTVGAMQWKKKKKAVGWKLEWRGDEFRFLKNPERLTFGGIAKGMAVGAVAEVLINSGANQFLVNGGGGNLATFENNTLTHQANSRIFRYGSGRKLNLLHPIGTRVHSNENVHLACTNFPNKSIRDSAGFTDALTKAVLLNPKFQLPQNCKL